MDDGKANLVALPGGGEGATRRTPAGNTVPSPPPGHRLDRQGLRLYDWIADALLAAGRDITAGGIQIMMLAHSLQSWSKDAELCAEEGRYGLSEKGNRFELPHSYNERMAREQIKRDLPEACLTVMSTIEAKLRESKTGASQQDDLFADLVDHGRARPSGTG